LGFLQFFVRRGDRAKRPDPHAPQVM
jgi:hypothetical protein